MTYLLLIILAFIAVYLGCRLFFLLKSIRRAEKELREITVQLEENRVVKLEAPCRELESMLEAINQNLAAIRAERRDYRKKELKLKEQIENISHDLRTPLTAILGYLKMMDTEYMSEEDREYLDIAIRKSNVLKNLVTQFYELSRITAEDFQMELVPVDGARVLREACLDHYGVFEKEHLKVQMELLETPVMFLGDKESLERVFANLLQNSVRYAKSELQVCLYRNAEEKNAVFVFKNDIDPQIEVEEPERLFDRFYMQEQSRSRGGTGLGLTISKHLVEHMHGKIRAEYCGDWEEENNGNWEEKNIEEKSDGKNPNKRFLVITITFPEIPYRK